MGGEDRRHDMQQKSSTRFKSGNCDLMANLLQPKDQLKLHSYCTEYVNVIESVLVRVAVRGLL